MYDICQELCTQQSSYTPAHTHTHDTYAYTHGHIHMHASIHRHAHTHTETRRRADWFIYIAFSCNVLLPSEEYYFLAM